MASLALGLKGESSVKVCDSNTAAAFSSGAVSVFGTPAMIGLMENAARVAVEPLLEKGQTTVGTRMNVEHLAATPLGMTVWAYSELVEIDGRKLVFKVEARDEEELVGTGTHERFIVMKEKFLTRSSAKGKQL